MSESEKKLKLDAEIFDRLAREVPAPRGYVWVPDFSEVPGVGARLREWRGWGSPDDADIGCAYRDGRWWAKTSWGLVEGTPAGTPTKESEERFVSAMRAVATLVWRVSW